MLAPASRGAGRPRGYGRSTSGPAVHRRWSSAARQLDGRPAPDRL